MRYRCIAADPPWPERGGGKIKRGADRHYPVEAVEDIPRTMMRARSGLAGLPMWTPDTSAHLWLWATNNYLPGALWVMERLGFTYKTNWCWVKGVECATCARFGDSSVPPCEECGGSGVKVQTGLGQYQRGSHELLLLGTRGQASVPPPTHRRSSVFVAKRTRHSEKPETAYQLMELISGEPRLEMFARAPRPGWDVWGNEA